MSVLTTINGMPLFSTPQEALQWAASNNLQGYHTHTYNGQIGYMGGASHGAAASSSQGINQNTTSNNTLPASSSSGFSGNNNTGY